MVSWSGSDAKALGLGLEPVRIRNTTLRYDRWPPGPSGEVLGWRSRDAISSPVTARIHYTLI